MRLRHAHLLTALLAAAALAGCDRSDARPQGTFTLVGTQRGPLPALLGDRENCIYSAVGGAVEMEADSFRATMLRERRCIPLQGTELVPRMEVDTLIDRGEGAFQVREDSLFFYDRRGVGTGLGVVRGDSLTVQGPGQTLHYVREREP